MPVVLIGQILFYLLSPQILSHQSLPVQVLIDLLKVWICKIKFFFSIRSNCNRRNGKINLPFALPLEIMAPNHSF